MDDALVAAGSTVERVPIARRVLSPCQKNAPVLGARSLRSCLASHLAISYFFAFSPDLDHAAVGLGPPWETAADRIESATGSGWRHMRGG
jgi:hypothetical protein